MSDDPTYKLAATPWRATPPADQDATFANGKSVRPQCEYLLTLVTPSGPVGPAATSPLPGYSILEEIGRGGMGVVFRAIQEELGREVAIKRIGVAHRDVCERFMAESRISGRLDHPGIVPVYDLLINDRGDIALVMKLVRGKSWKKILHPDDGTPPRDLDFHLDVLASVANAVAFAHSKGFSHNDLKPANVMVGEFGEVLVADWGLALHIADEPDPSSPAPHKSTLGDPSGTPAYWAPELARGDGAAIGRSTDVYLLGAILYELATGRPPHRGGDIVSAIASAVRSDPAPFDPGAPLGLEAICRKAMAPSPHDRYPTMEAFQDALAAFRANRESLAISREAARTFERARGGVGDPELRATGAQSARRLRIYAELAEAAGGFRQALVLWADNPEAVQGERDASLALAGLALENGDLGLAEAHASRLAPDDPDVTALTGRLAQEKADRARGAKTARRLRRVLAAAVAFIVVGLSAGIVALRAEQRRTEVGRTLANARLADIRRLADVQQLADAIREADALWPAYPNRVAAMEAWLVGARSLAKRLDGHRAYLDELRLRARESTPSPRFASAEEQWEYDTLAGLVAGLEGFVTDAIPNMERRIEFARSVAHKTLEEPGEAWARAVESIADPRECPAYGGLTIAPQLGLIPLGRDPRSGLHEFAHLASGEVPVRGPDGRLTITETTGVVLVLLPGGTFRMGAIAPSAKARAGEPHVDPRARRAEQPVHEITLVPFFIGKYELTQSQWLRAAGTNPSAYPTGRVFGERTVTGMNPVEQMSWKDATRVLDRLGLGLATEAQWEYAARAGTTTVFWTGEEKESLEGAANLADRYCKEHGGPGSWQFEMWLDDGHVVHAPVGTYRPNAFGLHEMVGNVWEFVKDHYGAYTLPVSAGDGERRVESETPRVFRGGGFRSSAVHARSADRYTLYAPDYVAFDVGVRAARPVE